MSLEITNPSLSFGTDHHSLVGKKDFGVCGESGGTSVGVGQHHRHGGVHSIIVQVSGRHHLGRSTAKYHLGELQGVDSQVQYSATTQLLVPEKIACVYDRKLIVLHPVLMITNINLITV